MLGRHRAATETQLASIAHVIQLAVAPLLPLTAVGTVIGVLSGRLARTIDRLRVLEERLASAGKQPAQAAHDETSTLLRRMRMIYLAIALAVISALSVGLLIGLAFVDAFVPINLARMIAALFVGAMVAFVASLIAFLREIYLAVTSARSGMLQSEKAREGSP
jgi:F0F1-type ATP synthase assembly protein I